MLICYLTCTEKGPILGPSSAAYMFEEGTLIMHFVYYEAIYLTKECIKNRLG